MNASFDNLSHKIYSKKWSVYKKWKDCSECLECIDDAVELYGNCKICK